MDAKKYLYLQVYDDLKIKIAQGRYKGGSLLPSEREIGDLYKVDRTTVRKALEHLVADGLVEKRAGVGTRVIACEPISPAERGPHRTVAFFLPKSTRKTNRISQPFYSSIFYRMEQECRRHQYALVYSTLDSEDDFPAMLEAAQYTGIVFVSNVERRFIDHARLRRVPSVLINELHPGVPSINSDNIGGMAMACEHLLALGHTRFALITGIEHYLTTRERMMACVCALAQAGLRIQDQYLERTDWEPASGYEATLRILSSGTPRPSAIIAFNDSLALGCMRAIYELGLRVPDDISLIGFDDLDQARNAIPPLTSVHQHIAQLARTSMQSLHMQIDNPESDHAVRLTVPCSLVVRGSTAPPRTD